MTQERLIGRSEPQSKGEDKLNLFLLMNEVLKENGHKIRFAQNKVTQGDKVLGLATYIYSSDDEKAQTVATTFRGTNEIMTLSHAFRGLMPSEKRLEIFSDSERVKIMTYALKRNKDIYETFFFREMARAVNNKTLLRTKNKIDICNAKLETAKNFAATLGISPLTENDVKIILGRVYDRVKNRLAEAPQQ